MSDEVSNEISKLIRQLGRKKLGKRSKRVSGKTRRARNRYLNKYVREHGHGMDDSHIFNQANTKSDVILGVYDSEGWVYAEYLRRNFLSRRQTLDITATWITPAEFKLSDWVIEMKFDAFTFFSSHTVVIQLDNGYLRINGAKSKIDVNLVGTVEFCLEWEKFFGARFKRAENLIEWVYNARGDSTSVPLNYRPALSSAYPWLNKPMNEYIQDFLNSDANVLILIGQPGTGKTTFIKNMIHQAGGDAKVAYDEKVLSTDDFFAGFIEDDCRFLIMEDADAFLSSRQDGNSMMHKFLNVSDGLVSAADKKLVFSTNLPNIRDVDSALLREGRCFDVLQFRALTRDEAKKVYNEAGIDKDLPDGTEFTLAELFNTQLHQKKLNGIGFI